MEQNRAPAVIIIGRNEGERLIACLASVAGQGGRVIYVDSGSTDGSKEAAAQCGAEVVALDMSIPFTAARARNAGLDRLAHGGAGSDFVQFVDGDCVLHPGWIATAQAFLETHPDIAVVAGRLRERYPGNSVYNRLCDAEWDTPIGEARACGGIAMMRLAAVEQAGRFNAALIAGEEPELCVRLRRNGGRIWRIDAEMGLHDAAMTRFGQWWQRCRRGGFAFAEAAAMHGGQPERHGVHELQWIVLWGMVLPAATVIGAFLTPWALILLALWPVQVLRFRRRGMPWHRALFLTLAKLPEAQGALTYGVRRVFRSGPQLIEYK